METIAVYWESKIRIYGITIKPELAFFRLAYPAADGSFWSGQLEGLRSVTDRFYLLTMQVGEPGMVQLNLLVEATAAADTYHFLEAVDTRRRYLLSLDEDITLIYLHGPHFQDRYGIADAALSLLQRKGISLLASGCTGTSIHLVVSSSVAAAVVQCLGETFVVPGPDTYQSV